MYTTHFDDIIYKLKLWLLPMGLINIVVEAWG